MTGQKQGTSMIVGENMIMPDSDQQHQPKNDAVTVNEYGSIHVP